MRRPCLAAAALAAAAALLAGCEGIGEGTAPTGVTISYAGITEAFQTYECAALQLAATAHFEGGSTSDGDVTGRVAWTSSNPGVIDVSNGEIEAEPGSGSYFPPGTVVARTTGTALIRADYVGLSDQFSVSAAPIGELQITPGLTRLAPGSTQIFKLEVGFEDDEPDVDLTDSAVWTILSQRAPASLVGTSTIAAVSDPLDYPFTLEARLFTCDRHAQRTLALGTPGELRLSYEQPANLPVPLGFSDEIRVEAVFEDGAEPQNLSGQVEIEQILGDDDHATITVDEYLTVTGLGENKSVQYSLRYKPLELLATTRVFAFADLEIIDLRVTPQRSELYYPDTLQLEAIGLFADGHERPVRRDVAWSSLNEDLVSVVTSGYEAGKLTPLGLEGDATVRASTSNSEGEIEADADMRVYVPR